MHFFRTRRGRRWRPGLLQRLLWFPALAGLARGGLAIGATVVLANWASAQTPPHEPLCAPEPAHRRLAHNEPGRQATPKSSATGGIAMGGIAVIDLQYVFDHEPGFARAKAEIDVDIQLAETMLELRKASLDKLRTDQQRAQRGSKEHQRLDELLAEEATELAVQVQSQRAELVRRQAELYRQTYQRIQGVVDAYVEEAGLVVVLRFTRSETADSDDAKEVARLLNRPVVAYKKPADITDEVLRRLAKAPPLEVVRQPKRTPAPK